MRSNYKKLGKYIRQVDERNSDLAITNLQGVSIAKEFIPSIANIIGTDLSAYKIVRTGQFAYGPVTSRNGDKVSIAQLKGEDCIISSSYLPFEVYKPNELLPEYLMLWFKRPEFDRYARFMSNGSAREVFDWDAMCSVELPVPSLSEQRKIVHDYEVITNRIKLLQRISVNLENQAMTIFHSAIEGYEKNSSLSELSIITMGTSPEGETLNDNGIGEVFYQGRTDFGFRFPSVRLFTTDAVRRAKRGDILVSVRAPVGDVNIAKEDCAIGRGLASIRPRDKCYSFLYYTMKKLYHELKRFNDEGTVFGSITKDDLAELKVAMLSSSERNDFEREVQPIDECIQDYELETYSLLGLLDNLLSGLAKGVIVNANNF